HHVRGHNARAIGIELVNTGRYPHWLDSRQQAMDEAYPHRQIDALVALLHDLSARFPALRHIAGHEDLDRDSVAASDDPTVQVRRKLDPGPRFPWPRVLADVALQRLGRARWRPRTRGHSGATGIIGCPLLSDGQPVSPALGPVVSELIDLLALERLEQDLFRGQSRDIGTRYVFGGQVLGQALAAAQATLDNGRRAHSLHAYFLRAGDIDHPIVYHVDRTRD